MSQLNLPHGTNNCKVENRKTKKQETDMLRSIGEQSRESVESVLKKKRKATVGRICTIAIYVCRRSRAQSPALSKFCYFRFCHFTMILSKPIIVTRFSVPFWFQTVD